MKGPASHIPPRARPSGPFRALAWRALISPAARVARSKQASPGGDRRRLARPRPSSCRDRACLLSFKAGGDQDVPAGDRRATHSHHPFWRRRPFGPSVDQCRSRVEAAHPTGKLNAHVRSPAAGPSRERRLPKLHFGVVAFNLPLLRPPVPTVLPTSAGPLRPATEWGFERPRRSMDRCITPPAHPDPCSAQPAARVTTTRQPKPAAAATPPPPGCEVEVIKPAAAATPSSSQSTRRLAFGTDRPDRAQPLVVWYWFPQPSRLSLTHTLPIAHNPILQGNPTGLGPRASAKGPPGSTPGGRTTPRAGEWGVGRDHGGADDGGVPAQAGVRGWACVLWAGLKEIWGGGGVSYVPPCRCIHAYIHVYTHPFPQTAPSLPNPRSTHTPTHPKQTKQLRLLLPAVRGAGQRRPHLLHEQGGARGGGAAPGPAAAHARGAGGGDEGQGCVACVRAERREGVL